MGDDLRAAAAAGPTRAGSICPRPGSACSGPGSRCHGWRLDAAAVEAHALRLAARVRAELGLPQADSAIVSIDRPDAAQRLERAGRARVGFHLYNTDADVDRLLDALLPASGRAHP